MGDVIQGKFKPRWPPSHLIVHLRELANQVERGEVTSLEAIFIKDGLIMFLHGANPELALKMSKVLVECNLQRIPPTHIELTQAGPTA